MHSVDANRVPGSPELARSDSSRNKGQAQPTLADGLRIRAPRRRSKPWSVLDLIWSFGDYSSLSWSAKFRIEPSIVVAAHDGVTLNQFLLDLTKAILDGQGWEVLHSRTRFDGSCYVIADTRAQSFGSGSNHPDPRRQLPCPSAGSPASTRHFPAA